MSPPRIEDLLVPPEVGALYDVPGVARDGGWRPMLGPPHADPELVPYQPQSVQDLIHLAVLQAALCTSRWALVHVSAPEAELAEGTAQALWQGARALWGTVGAPQLARLLGGRKLIN